MHAHYKDIKEKIAETSDSLNTIEKENEGSN